MILARIKRKLSAVRKRCMLMRLPRNYPEGTGFSLRYRLRRAFGNKYRLSCYVKSVTGTWHYLSTDPIDDRVLEEMLGRLNHLYFPALPAAITNALNQGGWLLDVGAFNGSWAAEVMVLYPRTNALLVEPSPEKQASIGKTLRANRLAARARIVSAGLASAEGDGWLVSSEEGSWGDWVQLASHPDVGHCARISTLTLSGILDGVEPMMIKCNAEGAEFELVRQMIALGLRPKLIILMVHPQFGEQDQLWADLVANGYAVTVAWDLPSNPCWHAMLN